MILPTLIAQSLGSFESQSPLTQGAEADPARNLEIIISNVIGFLTVLGGLFFIVYFLIAALEWITAGGDSGKLSNARNRMIQGVIGLVILVAAYGIVGLIGTIVGLDLLNPATVIENIVPDGTTTP